MSSADIKAWLVKEFESRGTLTKEKDWKRRSKSKNDQDEEVRVFEHSVLGTHTIIESNTGDFRFKQSEPVIPLNPAFQKHLFSVEHDDEDEDLTEEDENDLEYTHFILCDIDIEKNSVVFFCGPQVGGSLYDQHTDEADDIIYAAFPDRSEDGTLSLSNAESMHSIDLHDGEDPEKLALYIITALSKQGVINVMQPNRIKDVLGRQYSVFMGEDQAGIDQSLASQATVSPPPNPHKTWWKNTP